MKNVIMPMCSKNSIHALVAFIILAGCLVPVLTYGQTVHAPGEEVLRARVLEVVSEGTISVIGTELETPVQTIRVRILDGARETEEVVFDNDYIQLAVGDDFYMNYFKPMEGDPFYMVREFDRRHEFAVLMIVFVLAIVVFGGIQGARSLVALLGSLVVIVAVLVPMLVAGYPPIPTSVVVAGAILFFAIFFTHGFNRESLAAYLGTISAVVLSGILAYVVIHAMHLTGFAADESVYLNLNTDGRLDFVGLLLAAIIIGSLGVLDDIAITQASVVRELMHTGNMNHRAVFTSAMRVGKDHVGALVNTLVLAYTGAALPLLLLFSLSSETLIAIVNQEVFATEIVRAVVGSIGLVLTVPITTVLAVWVFGKNHTFDTDTTHGHAH